MGIDSTDQIQVWEGDFGDSYTDRNIVDWQTRLPAFRTMLDGLEIGTVLEVGCNRGHNLVVLGKLFPPAGIVGIEPNWKAIRIAQQTSPATPVVRCHGFAVPFRDGTFDLVFTANVLIHVCLKDLPAAMTEIHRVSGRFIMAVEYYAEEETVIHYRGHDDLLWKRNFRRHYESMFPELKPVRSGYWDRSDGFDRSHWWLWEK